ncbi:MAG: vancomycin high temperature exclusion protein [Acutalibacteraceae bacterium]
MKKWFRIAAGSVLLALVYALAVNFIVIGGAKPYIADPADVGTGYDCILVLGCQVNGETPSDMLRDRLDRAVALYKAGVSDTLLLSGDHLSREGYDEVTAMQKYVLGQGVPQEAIRLDLAGFSTYESMYRAGEVFGMRRVLVVTQPYHLYRAVYVARRLGLEATGTQSMPNRYVYPLYNQVREVLARNKDFLYTIIKPEP